MIEHPEITNEMSKCSRQFVAENFDRVLMQNELLRFYESLDIEINVKKEVKQA